MTRRTSSKIQKIPPPRKVYYVLSAHWDREWYQTFQDFRRRLVKLFDRTLDDLKSGRLQGAFTADGQAIILEDYLEIRPERRGDLEKFARSGKLKIGPWYVLPDEWLVSGEALIRNLRLGRQVARDFGGVPSDAGFVCDLFGHVSQLPQILAGFGIRAGLLWRGLEPRSSAHLMWEGADGTRLLCYRFGRGGYCDYAFDVRHCTQWDHTFEPGEALSDLQTFLAREANRTAIPPLLIFDGGDHLEYHSGHYKILTAQKPSADFPYEIVHATLDEYLAEMAAHAGAITETVTGELRETGRLPMHQDQQWLIPGVLSSRVWIKQENAKIQSLLCQWAEPFAGLAARFAGAAHPDGYLNVAWRWLLQNHPHDSICGCSIDAVHTDMKYRFAQAAQIAGGQTDESLKTLAAAIKGTLAERELRIFVANPLAKATDEPVLLTLGIPSEWKSYNEFFGFEPKPAFRIFDASGREIPYQLLSVRRDRTRLRTHGRKFSQAQKTHRVSVCLRVPLPALGYTTLTVREGESFSAEGVIAEQAGPTRHGGKPLATGGNAMENELLKVVIESDGSLSITDKRTGQTYRRQMVFEDAADIGDGWYHGPPVSDEKFVSIGAAADVALMHDGPLFCQFRVRKEMRLPAGFDFPQGKRSGILKSFVVENWISLHAGCDRVEIRTEVENNCQDHRLRVLFDTGIDAPHYLSDSAFDVVERPVGLPKDNHLGRELAVETTPQQSWTAISDARRGLAVIAPGLMETAVCDEPERPIALTLFRATSRTVFTDGEPDGQIQEKLSFEYWLVPFAGKADRTRLFNNGLQLLAGLRTIQLQRGDEAMETPGAALPPSASFFEVRGNVVTTSIRLVDGALEVRLFNPDARKTTATLDFSAYPAGLPRPKKVTRVNFESVALGKSQTFQKRLTLPFRGKEIVTVKLAW